LLVLGLVWILFLSPQYIGIIIISVAVFMAFKTSQSITQSPQEVAGSPGSPIVKE